MSVEQVLGAIAIFLIVSVLASKASGRLGVPVLILFLGVGMMAGSEGLGIAFDNAMLAQRLGVIALVFILFAGGLETDWSLVRSAAWRATTLATAGVLVTALLVGWFAHVVVRVSLLEGMLLGAIVSSTDAAAVFSILRSKGVKLRRDLAATLELESGSNDPMAVFLTTAVLQLMTSGESVSPLQTIVSFVQQMAFGAVAGVLFGVVTVRLLNKARLEFQGLYPVLTIGIVLLTYSATSLIGGNGFLAVYLLGITLARNNFVQRRTLIRFHDGIAWLMQIAMFVTLGLLVFPKQLLPVAGVSLAVALFLMLVARPAAVFLCLLFFRVPVREQALVSWVGLRGAVPIILATFPLVAGVPIAGTIFNIVFFIVFASVLLQGTTVAVVARWLRLDTARDGEGPVVGHLAGRGESALITVAVAEGSRAAGRRVVELPWPREALILVMYRGDEFFAPNGATELAVGDRLIVLTSKSSVEQIQGTVAGVRGLGA